MIESAGKAALVVVAASSLPSGFFVSAAVGADPSKLHAVAGPDRVTVLPGKTYLKGWAGFDEPEKKARASAPPGPPPAQLDFYMAKGANPESRMPK